MTFSDALPVQFWDADCDTFNEKEVDGIFNKCFCAPWEAADEITTQFKDTPGQTRTLLILNSIGEDLYEQDFTEVVSGIYQLSFIPESIGIIDDQINLNIVTKDSIQRIIAPSLWTNDTKGGTGSTWDSKGASNFFESTLSSADSPYIYVYQPAVVPSGESIVVTLNVLLDVPGAGFPNALISINAFLADGSGNSVSTIETVDQSTYSSLGSYTQREVITVNDGSTSSRLYLVVVVPPGISGSASLSITIDVGEILYIPASSILKKSDCLSIKETQEETVLINYHNNRIFSSLNSAVGTPDPEFNLRIPAIFFRERFPKTFEVIKLSNSRNIQTMAEIEFQRLLQVKNMPAYMHLKTQLALSFQNVTIDGFEWVARENYEPVDSTNPRWPMNKAQIWLNRKDYIVRNIL